MSQGSESLLAARRTRRSSEDIARETVDAIRLALEAAADDASALALIRTLVDESTPPRPRDTGSVERLIRAVKHTKRARWQLT